MTSCGIKARLEKCHEDIYGRTTAPPARLLYVAPASLDESSAAQADSGICPLAERQLTFTSQAGRPVGEGHCSCRLRLLPRVEDAFNGMLLHPTIQAARQCHVTSQASSHKCPLLACRRQSSSALAVPQCPHKQPGRGWRTAQHTTRRAKPFEGC